MDGVVKYVFVLNLWALSSKIHSNCKPQSKQRWAVHVVVFSLMAPPSHIELKEKTMPCLKLTIQRQSSFVCEVVYNWNGTLSTHNIYSMLLALSYQTKP